MNSRHTAVFCILASAFGLSFTLGCPQEELPKDRVAIYPVSAAPPSTVARIVSDRDRNIYAIDISKGVVVGARCWESDYDSNCEIVDFVVSPPEMMEVRPSYQLDAYNDDTYVLIGKETGQGSLIITTPKATITYAVTVSEPTLPTSE